MMIIFNKHKNTFPIIKLRENKQKEPFNSFDVILGTNFYGFLLDS